MIKLRTRKKLLSLVLSLVVTFFCFVIFKATNHIFFINLAQTPRVNSPGSYLAGTDFQVIQKEFSFLASYNAHGFRDINFKSKIAPSGDLKNVIFLGDSFAEGWGVDDNKRYSELISKSLSDKGVKYQAYNLAQLATGLDAFYLNLLDYGSFIKPEITVLSFFVGNDFIRARRIDLDQLFRALPRISIQRSMNTYTSLFDTSFLLASQLETRKKYQKYWDYYYKQKIDKKFFHHRSQLDSSEFEKYLKSFHPEFVLDNFKRNINPGELVHGIKNLKRQHLNQTREVKYNQEDLTHAFKIIKKTKEQAEDLGSKFVVVFIPTIMDIHPELYNKHLKENLKYQKIPQKFAQANLYKEKLMKMLSLENINYVDTTMALKQSSHKRLYYPIDAHLNVQGHEVVAKTVATFIQSLAW